ncbi:MAG TPA: hypothetical protein VN903_39795 [Polyangia bacterium]|nr:hypothetical protein [Polyangia bacterium]
MGVTLDYVTAAPVAETVRQAIESEAADLVEGAGHTWWAEAIYIGHDRDGVGFLVGSTKMFLIGYDVPGGDFREVDPTDDSLMAWRDASFIVGQLEKWSREHDLAWELRCQGALVGRINYGAADAAMRGFLAELVIDEDPTLDRNARIRDVDARYADRWAEDP